MIIGHNTRAAHSPTPYPIHIQSNLTMGLLIDTNPIGQLADQTKLFIILNNSY